MRVRLRDVRSKASQSELVRARVADVNNCEFGPAFRGFGLRRSVAGRIMWDVGDGNVRLTNRMRSTGSGRRE